MGSIRVINKVVSRSQCKMTSNLKQYQINDDSTERNKEMDKSLKKAECDTVNSSVFGNSEQKRTIMKENLNLD